LQAIISGLAPALPRMIAGLLQVCYMVGKSR
jgi:hypothetical protein